MSPSRADILAAINDSPSGFTSAALAHKLNTTSYRIGTVLSRLAAYGDIQKVPLHSRAGVPAIWKRKPAAQGTAP